MSKKGQQMDIYFQYWNIRRFLKMNMICWDTIDYRSLCDCSLYYPENERIIKNMIRGTNYDRL
jgi:hypothetical protein